jgi:hypothetical protein
MTLTVSFLIVVYFLNGSNIWNLILNIIGDERLSFKEMPVEEKHDKLLDQYILSQLMNFALQKEMGTLDKRNAMMLKVYKKMLPSLLGVTLKVMKTVAPSKTFKKMVDGFVSLSQIMVPLSNIEVTWVSDREAVMRTKNCPQLLRGKELAKKAGLDIDPKEICRNDSKTMPGMLEQFGMVATMELEENGCVIRAKLK